MTILWTNRATIPWNTVSIPWDKIEEDGCNCVAITTYENNSLVTRVLSLDNFEWEGDGKIYDVFSLVSWLYPEADTLQKIFERFDGRIYARSHPRIMAQTREELAEAGGRLPPTFTVVTAYSE